MSILVNAATRVLVQGITGFQGRMDTEFSLAYGTKIVCGVTPGRAGEKVHGVPTFNTVRAAIKAFPVDVSILYVPATALRDAALEAIDAGIKLLVATTENVPRHDAALIVTEAQRCGVRIVGFNTNGIITPGECKLAGIGGDHPERSYVPGRIGVCSRSGGMSAEISWTLKKVGLGVSTCVSMGGDPITGLMMVDYLRLFEADSATDAMIIFGEPGSAHEQGVAKAVRAGEIRKPVFAIVAGAFQESYPKGVSFGHVAAMISNEADTATAKRKMLADSGVIVVDGLDELAGRVLTTVRTPSAAARKA
jgi:succinyl-CoA synthetase alpha subunit